MACDLQIAGIRLPTPVVGACPSMVTVDVINMGGTPAVFPLPMTVCLDIKVSREGAPAAHYSIVTPPETPPIRPGKVQTFTFRNVQFPCASSGFVTATADCAGTVPNNVHPPAGPQGSLTVPVPTIGAMPWLWTSIRVGLKDSIGQITWGPGALCPGATCVVEASIRNAGCATAVPSVTTVELFDGAGTSITLLTKSTPSIGPGLTSVVQFVTTLPPTAVNKRIKLRACADDGGVVKPQCDRLHACDEIELPLVVTPGGPKLTIAATRPIFPGESVPITWRIQNFCSDIGKATAQISYQGTVLYTSVQIPVGLQDVEKGEDLDIAPTAPVAPNFYKIGTSKLTLQIMGTGTDPGPFTATTLVTVNAEPVSGTWAFPMPAPGTTAAVAWKSPFTVDGRLSNPSHATMTPSSVVLNETSNVFPPISRIATPAIGAIVPGAFGSAVWPLMQAWTWVIPGVWQQNGRWVGNFTYSVTFAMQDEYGNAYPAGTSSSAAVTVSVSGVKIGLATAAETFFATALVFVVLAIIAAAGYITALGAPALFGIATAAFAIATGLGAGALDPPVPNFDYHRIVPIKLPEFSTELTANPVFASILPIFALMARISGIIEAMSAAEARLIAARIDRDSEANQLQAAEYASLRDSLLATARQIPLSVVEGIDGMRAQPMLAPLLNQRMLQRTAAAWRRGLPAKLRQAWTKNGLPEQQLKDIERALRTKDFAVRSVDALLNDLPQAVALIANGIRYEAEGVLNAPAAGEAAKGGGEEPRGPQAPRKGR